jgi:adenylate cyclase
VMRVGIHSGLIVRGYMGSRYARRDYTCIGDVVNRAQRHEAKAPPGGVLLSEETHARIARAVEVEQLPGLTFKNVPGAHSGYVLRGFVEKA